MYRCRWFVILRLVVKTDGSSHFLAHLYAGKETDLAFETRTKG